MPEPVSSKLHSPLWLLHPLLRLDVKHLESDHLLSVLSPAPEHDHRAADSDGRGAIAISVEPAHLNENKGLI